MLRRAPSPSRLLSLLALLALLAVPACTTGDDLDPNTTPDAAAAVPDAGDGDAGLLPFMSPCEENQDCESNLCFAFNAAGPHCTHSCTVDTDCEEPSPGCNGMGVCKRPQ